MLFDKENSMIQRGFESPIVCIARICRLSGSRRPEDVYSNCF